MNHIRLLIAIAVYLLTACTDPCAVTNCPKGYTCIDGDCQASEFESPNCTTTGCPDGMECKNDSCVIVLITPPPPCETLSCQNGGQFVDCACNCPEGWAGETCEEPIHVPKPSSVKINRIDILVFPDKRTDPVTNPGGSCLGTAGSTLQWDPGFGWACLNKYPEIYLKITDITDGAVLSESDFIENACMCETTSVSNGITVFSGIPLTYATKGFPTTLPEIQSQKSFRISLYDFESGADNDPQYAHPHTGDEWVNELIFTPHTYLEEEPTELTVENQDGSVKLTLYLEWIY